MGEDIGLHSAIPLCLCIVLLEACLSRPVAYLVVILLKSRQGALVSWVLMPVALYNEDQGFLISPQNDFLTEHILVVMHHAKNWDKKFFSIWEYFLSANGSAPLPDITG